MMTKKLNHFGGEVHTEIILLIRPGLYVGICKNGYYGSGCCGGEAAHWFGRYAACSPYPGVQRWAAACGILSQASHAAALRVSPRH